MNSSNVQNVVRCQIQQTHIFRGDAINIAWYYASWFAVCVQCIYSSNTLHTPHGNVFAICVGTPAGGSTMLCARTSGFIFPFGSWLKCLLALVCVWCCVCCTKCGVAHVFDQSRAYTRFRVPKSQQTHDGMRVHRQNTHAYSVMKLARA